MYEVNGVKGDVRIEFMVLEIYPTRTHYVFDFSISLFKNRLTPAYTRGGVEGFWRHTR